MFVVTWYEHNVKQVSTFMKREEANQKAIELRKLSDLLTRTSFVPITVTEEKETAK